MLFLLLQANLGPAQPNLGPAQAKLGLTQPNLGCVQANFAEHKQFKLSKSMRDIDDKIKYLAPSMSEINSERGINHSWIGAEFGMKPDDTLRERSGYDFGILTDSHISTGSQVDILCDIVFQGGR